MAVGISAAAAADDESDAVSFERPLEVTQLVAERLPKRTGLSCRLTSLIICAFPPVDDSGHGGDGCVVRTSSADSDTLRSNSAAIVDALLSALLVRASLKLLVQTASRDDTTSSVASWDVLADRAENTALGYSAASGNTNAAAACSSIEETVHRLPLSVRADEEPVIVEKTAFMLVLGLLDPLGVDEREELPDGVGGRPDGEHAAARITFCMRSFSICSTSFSWCSVTESLVSCSDCRAKNARCAAMSRCWITMASTMRSSARCSS